MELAEYRYEKKDIERGYAGRVLWIDLGNFKFKELPVDSEMKEKFIGGRGFCLKLVWDGTTKDTKYDSPENVLVYAGGPMCGETSFPGTGKFIAGTISPLTGSFLDSNVGGHFAPLLKFAGFDGIALTGKAPKDVIIVVDGNEFKVTIEDAPEGEGALTLAEDLIRQYGTEGSLENTAVVAAGIGAVNSYFGITNSVYYDRRRGRVRSKQAGRGGTGTVMRTKGLKAVVVKSEMRKGNANNPADRDAVRSAGRELNRVIREVDPNSLRLDAWGTTVLVSFMDQFDLLPVNNYKYGTHPDAKNIYGEVFEKRFTHETPDGCYLGCTLACTKGVEEFELKTGPFKGKKVGVDGPEYETAATAPTCGIFDPDYLLEYNWYCDEYGIDTISMGITMGFLMECFERGFLTKEDTEGLELAFGNKDAAFELLHKVAHGEGFGSAAGLGIQRLKNWIATKHSKRSGEEYDKIKKELDKFGMECKGLEFSVYVTKESLAQQGGYGFALKGAQHDEAWLIFLDQINNEMPTFELKAQALKWFPLVRTWFNIMGLCKLPWIDVRNPKAAETENPAKNLPTIDLYLELWNGMIGTSKTLDDLLEDSERLYNFQKLFNLRMGHGKRGDDQIPARAMGPCTVEEYESKKEKYDKELTELLELSVDELDIPIEERLEKVMDYRYDRYQKLCDAVYKEKGWDENGIPLPETLERLGLSNDTTKTLLDQARG